MLTKLSPINQRSMKSPDIWKKILLRLKQKNVPAVKNLRCLIRFLFFPEKRFVQIAGSMKKLAIFWEFYRRLDHGKIKSPVERKAGIYSVFGEYRKKVPGNL